MNQEQVVEACEFPNMRLARNLHNALKRGTQVSMVLGHMLQKPTISPLEASELYRVKRLTSRITDLKDAGVKIISKRKIDLTGRPYVEYSLVQNG